MRSSGRVLVTGANGMIGRSLVSYLARHGFLVRGLDLHGDWAVNSFPAGPVECVTGDLRDEELLRVALNDVVDVVHLASAHLEVGRSADYFWQVNVEGTRRLAELASPTVRRFIYISSVGVYGGVEGGSANEETPCHPTIDYEKSKLAAEKEIGAVSRERGLETIILRPSWVFGPGCKRTRKLISAIRRGVFVMAGQGRNLRHPLFVEDMNRAIELVLNAGDVRTGEVYVVAGPAAVTLDELVHRFAAKLNPGCRVVRVPKSLVEVGLACVESAFGLLRKEPPVSRRTIKFFVENSSFDTAKFAAHFGYSPRYSIEEGLDATLATLD